MGAIVEIEDVTKDYPLGKLVVQALRGVSLRIDKGEFTTIAGPSGSGKTTTLDCIAGLTSPDQGHIWMNG